MFTFEPAHRIQRRTNAIASAAFAATLLGMGLACAPPVFAAEAHIDAAMRPSRISVDGDAQFEISVQGGQLAAPQAPFVDGLTFTPIEQSTREESINGVATSSVSQTYRVTASHPGFYTIPAIPFGNANTQPLVLQVLPAGSGAASAGASGGAALPAPPLNGNVVSGAASLGANAGRDAFVRVILPEKQLYVGELLPIEMLAYFRSDLGVDLNGPPVLKSAAFTLSNLSTDPKQTRESIGGVPYTVVTWHGGLAPVKDGDYPVPLELAVTVRTRRRPTQEQLPDLDSLLSSNGFDSSFLNDPSVARLLGNVVETPMTLESPAMTVSVLPLPAAGRPASFSGAVGSFDVSSQVTPTKVTQGDPLTVTLNVSGEGNFDRVNSAEVSADANWKTYRPGTTFSPGDSVGLRGTKSFEQSVIPLKAGSVQLPGLDFSYFDPKLRQYVTRHTPPMNVDVTPGQSVASTVTRTGLGTQASNSAPAAGNGATSQSVMSSQGAFVSSLIPVVDRSWFIALPTVPLAVMAGGLFLIRRRERSEDDPILAARFAANSQLTGALDALDAALDARDARGLMIAARLALQIRLAQLWKIDPADVNLHEIDSRLGGGWGPLRELFCVTEEVAYGGIRPEVGTLDRWRQVVLNMLKRLEQI